MIQFDSFLNPLRRIKHGCRRYYAVIVEFFGKKIVHSKVKGKIHSGPFRSAKFLYQDVFGSSTPKILGTYEKELHGTLASLQKTKPNVVVNVGAAEGYYAVGFATFWNVSKVYAYEMLQQGRELITANSRLNEVERAIEVRAECTETELHKLFNQHKVSLLVMDVEGAEIDLLSERVISMLVDTSILIESHDFARSGCLKKLIDLFSATHELTTIESKPRNAREFPLAISLSSRLKEKLMDEERPEGMSWIVGQPHAGRHLHE